MKEAPERAAPGAAAARTPAPPARIRPAASVLLDVIRFAAACAVAYGHFCSPAFSHGWIDYGASWDGVAVFFVLSGFVIRLVTTTRKMGQYEYFVDRASRMYSVVVPALLFDTVVALVCHWVQPAAHPFLFYMPAGNYAVDLLANLTYITQFWGMNISNPINPVFWSLSYECSYYAFYGVLFFSRGMRRWVFFGLLGLLTGPPILLLFPVWLAGVAAHDVYQRLRHRRGGLAGYTAFLLSVGAALFAARAMLGNLIGSAHGLLDSGVLRTIYTLGKQHDFHFVQRANVYFYFVGIPTALLLVWLLLLVDKLPVNGVGRGVRTVRRIADGTFALYLFHHAFYILILATVPYNKDHLAPRLAILFSVAALSILIAVPCDWLKDWMREALHARRPSLTASVGAGAH